MCDVGIAAVVARASRDCHFCIDDSPSKHPHQTPPSRDLPLIGVYPNLIQCHPPWQGHGSAPDPTVSAAEHLLPGTVHVKVSASGT